MKKKWILLVVGLFILGTISPGFISGDKPPNIHIVGAANILGDPIQINVTTNGMIDMLYKKTTTYIDSVYNSDTCTAIRYSTAQAVRQYGHDPDAGPVLGANGQFTYVSQTNPTSWTVINNWSTPDGVTIVQTILYTNGQKFFNIQWQVSTTTSISNLKLFHGSDVYVEGNDANDELRWDPPHNLVYAKDVTHADSYIMGLYGVTPPTEHQVDSYGDMWASILSGTLNNQDFQSAVDGGMALAWTRSSLSPGQTWIVDAVWIMDPAFPTSSKIPSKKIQLPSMLPLARNNLTKAGELTIQANNLLSQAKAKGKDTGTCENLIREATELLAKANTVRTNPIYANNLALQASEKLKQAIDCLKALIG